MEKKIFIDILSVALALSGLIPGQSLAKTQTPPAQRSSNTEIGANDPMAHARLRKTQDWLKKSHSLDIHFITIATDAHHLQSENNPVRGALLLSGEKYRLNIGNQTFFCDGKNMWAYSPEVKEVSIYAYQESAQSMNPIEQIKNYDKYYRAKYIRQQSLDGINRHIIDLIPIESSEVMKIRVFLNPNDARIYRIEMYLPHNQVYVYKDLKYKENPSVSEKDFVFDTRQFPEVMVNDMR